MRPLLHSPLRLAFALLLCLTAPAVAQPAAMRPALPPPWASGAGAGLLGPAPVPAATGGHIRGTLALGAAEAAPLVLDYRLGASASAFGWAEAGATFGGRWLSVGQHRAGPIELWLRAGPRLGAVALQAILEVASGRGGFDQGGALYPSTTTLGALVAAERGRLSGWLSAAYQSAGDDLTTARYRGLQVGAAGWLAVFRDPERYDVQLGAEALVRLGWTAERSAEIAAIFAITARLADEHGAAFAAGGGRGWGGGTAGYGAARLGWSFGPSYRYPARTTSPLLDELADWIREQWARRTAPGFGALHLPPPYLLPPPAGTPAGLARPLAPPLPPHCADLPRLPARDELALALRSCTAAWDLGRPAPKAGPAPPQEPYGPPPPPGGLAQAPPRPPRPPGVPRGGWRTGRGGAGYTEPDTRAPAPTDLPPTVWTGGRPGGPSMSPADAPPPPPSIPIRPQPPGPLPAGVSPEEVPPYLRPAATGAARRPMAAAPPRSPATHAEPRATPAERPAAHARPIPAPSRPVSNAAADGEAAAEPARRTDCPNPWGCEGKPDHRATVEELKQQAQREFPDRDRYEVRVNKSVEQETRPASGGPGLRRRPDVAVIDNDTGHVVKVYEAARANKDGVTPVARERKKVEQYDRRGIPSHVKIVR